MYNHPMEKISKSEVTRGQILAKGYELLLQRGFTAVGIKDILEAAEVPKGSFYYYFPSKEVFGCELLEQYVENYLARMGTILDTEASDSHAADSPKARLMRYWAAWIRDPETGCSAFEQCLVVKLSAEVSDISEDMRKILSLGVERITHKLASTISEGLADGSLPALDTPEVMAKTLYQLWLGAALVAKIESNKTALQQALKTTEKLLLF